MQIKSYAQKSILLAISTSYELVIKKLNQELKDLNCNYTQALILLAIYFEKQKSITPSQAANALHTSKSNIAHALKSLETNDLIKRNFSRRDARSFEISLTSLGEKRIPKLIKVIDKYENQFDESNGRKETEEICKSLYNFSFHRL